jgi:hypothetical protein
MRAKFLVIVIWFALTGSSAFTQDEKTEVAVFAGGYFNSGFQSFKVLNPTKGAQVREKEGGRLQRPAQRDN